MGPAREREQADAFVAELGSAPAARAFVEGVLDKRDRKGRFPKTFTFHAGERELRALDELLPPRTWKRKSGGGVVVQLARLEELLREDAADHGRPFDGLEALFDCVSGRTARNRTRDRAARRAAVVEAVERGFEEGRVRAEHAGAELGDAAVLGFLDGQRRAAAAGEWAWRRVERESGLQRVKETAARLAAGLLIARTRRRDLVRLDHVSLLVAGDTKALRPDRPDYARLTDGLARVEPELAARAASEAGGSAALRRRVLLEHLGIVTNDTPVDVLVRGPLALVLGEDVLEDFGLLARHGLSSKVGLAQLRAADRVATRAGRVLTVENETAFCGIADAHPRDLVVFSRGQPTFACTLLLRRLAESTPSLRFAHAGDLDRSGLLIYRTLRRRTGLDIRTHLMDVPTFDAHRHVSRPMSDHEASLTARLSEEWVEPDGAPLLARLAEVRRWIEQEWIVADLPKARL